MISDGMRNIWLLAAIVVVLVGFVSFMQPTAFATYPACALGSTNETVNITGNCVFAAGEQCINGTMTITGNITDDGTPIASLYMENCTVLFNNSYDGEFGFWVTNGQVAINNSVIKTGPFNSSTKSFFYVLNIMSFELYNSEVSNIGVNTADPTYNGIFAASGGSIIENNTITGSDKHGLILKYNSQTVKNNTIYNNAEKGIYLQSSNSSTLSLNNVSFNKEGIRVQTGYFNLIANNTVANNSRTALGAGIVVWGAPNTTVENNTILFNNDFGIFLNAVNFVNITNNNITNNNVSGIFMQAQNYIEVMFNSITNHSYYGADVSTVTNSNIWNNTFCYNKLNATNPNSGTPGANSFVFNNTFCIDLLKPKNGEIINTPNFTFFVSNPLGTTNIPSLCNVSVDSQLIGQAPTFGPEEILWVNNSSVSEGNHSIYIYCDPYQNEAETEGEFILDASSSQYSDQFKSGDCGDADTNLTLGAYWIDAVTNISYVWLATNETGSMTNYTDYYGSPMFFNDTNETWANFSWWNSSVQDSNIEWRQCANDSASNENCTEIANFTASPCAPPPEPPPPAGVGGAAPPPSPYSCSATAMSLSLSNVALGTYEEETYTDYCNGIRLDEFYAAASGDVKFTIKVIDEFADKPIGRIYHYYNASIGDELEGNVSDIKLGFGVNNSWLLENNIGYGDIEMQHYEDGNWTTLAMRNVDRDENSSYYQTTIPSLSLLAVVGEPECVCPEPSEWSDCVEGNQTRTAYDCGTDTDYECIEITQARECALECEPCPDTIYGSCIEGKREATYFYCNETTQFLCANHTVTEACAIIGLPKITLPEFKVPETPLEWVQTVSIAAVVVVIVAVGAYYVFRVRKKPKKPKKKK